MWMLRPRASPLDSSAGSQRGITGLETAIVLIAFVVVASVLAFAILSTGLISSERSKKTLTGALAETSATLVLRGTVHALARPVPPPWHITDVKFQLTNASRSGEAVNLSITGLNAAIVTYIDSEQSTNLTTWTTDWLSGSGPLLQPGETVEINVDVSGLSPRLMLYKNFIIEVKPTVGATLVVNRTTPGELTAVVDLG